MAKKKKDISKLINNLEGKKLNIDDLKVIPSKDKIITAEKIELKRKDIFCIKIDSDQFLSNIIHAENNPIIDTEESTKSELIGFYFKVESNIDNKTSDLGRIHSIVMEPVYLKVKLDFYGNLINVLGFESLDNWFSSENESVGSPPDPTNNDIVELSVAYESMVLEDSGGLDPLNLPKKITEELEFFEGKSNKNDFSYISKDEIKILAELWKELRVSGALLRVGNAFSTWAKQSFNKTSFFAVKIEGDALRNGDVKGKSARSGKAESDPQSSADLMLPQMFNAMPCPPYWRPISDTKRVIQNLGGGSMVANADPNMLTHRMIKNWQSFIAKADTGPGHT